MNAVHEYSKQAKMTGICKKKQSVGYFAIQLASRSTPK